MIVALWNRPMVDIFLFKITSTHDLHVHITICLISTTLEKSDDLCIFRGWNFPMPKTTFDLHGRFIDRHPVGFVLVLFTIHTCWCPVPSVCGSTKPNGCNQKRSRTHPIGISAIANEPSLLELKRLWVGQGDQRCRLGHWMVMRYFHFLISSN